MNLPAFRCIRATHCIIAPPVNPAGYLPEGFIHIETVTTVTKDYPCQGAATPHVGAEHHVIVIVLVEILKKAFILENSTHFIKF